MPLVMEHLKISFDFGVGLVFLLALLVSYCLQHVEWDSESSAVLAIHRDTLRLVVGAMTTLGWLSVLISAQLGKTLDKLLGWLSGLGVNDDLQLPQRIGLPGSCLDMCLVRLLLLESVLSQILHVCVVFL